MDYFFFASIKRWVKNFFQIDFDEMRRPRIVWGYQNSCGNFHPLIRISTTISMENPEKVTIENNAFIHHFVVIQGSGEVLIEEGCQIGPWVKISSWKSRTTRIGRYAYISAGATIEDGVSIGKGAIIEANAIVNKDIPDFAIVNESGEVIGSTKSLDALELLDPQLKTWYEEWQAG